VAHQWADRVAETSTTTGTGALTLAGAVTGFQRFSAVCSVNDTVIFAIEAVDGSGVPTGDWEVGVGTYSALNTLTRTTVIKSSNSNAAVSFAAGTKNVFLDDIASTRNTLQQYSGTSEPSAPVEGLIHYARDFNGFPLPWSRGPTYRSEALFPLVTGRPTYAIVLGPAGATQAQALGITWTNTNGLTVTPNTANTYQRFTRMGYQTTATASTAGGGRDTNTNVIPRGTGTYDAFWCRFVFGLETVGNTNCRWFVGLTTSAGALAATYDPATALNMFGMGASSADTTNAKLYYNDGAGTPTSIDLGANYPAKTAAGGVFELILWAEASASTIKYHLRRLDNSAVAPSTGTLATDLPTAGTQLYPQIHINNNATAANSALSFMSYIVETGF
jgi:hypothetical protein